MCNRLQKLSFARKKSSIYNEKNNSVFTYGLFDSFFSTGSGRKTPAQY